MINTYKAKITMPSDRELIITREFAAPATVLYEALTKPEHVREWYGPRVMKLLVCDIDLRVGGRWRYVVQGPDGSQHGFSGEYKELVPAQRIVSTEGYEGMPGTDYLATVTLTEQGGKTMLTNHLVYQMKEHRDGHVASGMEGGMNETYDRLDEVVAQSE